MTAVVDSTLFDNFGKVTYDPLSSGISTVVRDVTFVDNKFELFRNLCESIINGSDDYNVLLMHNLVFHLTNQNTKLVDDIVISVFDSYSKHIYDLISESIKTGNFKIKTFIDLYNMFYQNAQKLSKQLTYFDNKVLSDNSNKYSHVNMIRGYMFYKNVINMKYQYLDNKEYYLYDILTKSIESGDGLINEILQLFKMYSFYIRLSYVVKANKDTLFNSEINKLFLVTLGSNQTFVKTIMQYINNTLKSLYNKTNKSEADVLNIEELIGLISNHFLEKDMFNMYYEKLFESRLLSGEFDSDVEKKLLSKFKRPVDNGIVQNMIYKLKDIEENNQDRINYNKLEITITSDKYKGKVNVSALDPKIVQAKLFRNYAWSHTKENEKSEYALPFELQPYIDIYNQFYKVRYPYREITWNFNYGIGTVKLSLGGKQYLVQLTTPQMLLLLQFNNATEIPAVELAKNLNIPLSKLGSVINSFIRSQILKKEIGKPANDPTIKIILNQNFTFDSDKISLVSIMMNSVAQQQQPQVDKEISEKFSLGRDTVVEAYVVRTMKQNKHLTYEELLSKVRSQVPFQFNDTKFTDIVKTCISKKFMKVNQDMTYDYLDEEEDDDE
ncbi:cullin family protein [Fadolivirus algeromassiliense]|jgi:hypothetical protein|uniref:Cullin family protein n=1 Tax=Fadolivirus FV1/VV64 TaxID=3070911 RepID=A0A7D3USU3_9VIRU|nr:cullin family protein [Fadolivirus algeromassiliense]QKF93810.1 cullin family protein [Fadolivirus FV1/VV64]